MPDIYQQLISVATEHERSELELLSVARKQCVDAYQADSCKRTKENWDAADEKLAREVERLQQKYFSAQPAFKNIMEVHAHLKDEGYKIGKSKLYQDQKAGLLVTQPDGRVHEADVHSYIIRAQLKKKDNPGRREHDARSLDRSEAETRLAMVRADKEEFQLEKEKGRYLERDTFELELASRAAVLEAGLKYWVQAFAEELIALASGDAARAPAVIDRGVQMLDGVLNDYARTDQFQVLFVDGE